MAMLGERTAGTVFNRQTQSVLTMIATVVWRFVFIAITSIIVAEPYACADGQQQRVEPAVDPSADFDEAFEFPFLVGLTSQSHRLDNKSSVTCTGSLLSSTFILSSAHCASRLKNQMKVNAIVLSRSNGAPKGAFTLRPRTQTNVHWYRSFIFGAVRTSERRDQWKFEKSWKYVC